MDALSLLTDDSSLWLEARLDYDGAVAFQHAARSLLDMLPAGGTGTGRQFGMPGQGDRVFGGFGDVLGLGAESGEYVHLLGCPRIGGVELPAFGIYLAPWVIHLEYDPGHAWTPAQAAAFCLLLRVLVSHGGTLEAPWDEAAFVPSTRQDRKAE